MFRVIDPITVYRTGNEYAAGVLSNLEDISDHGKTVLLKKCVIAEVEGPPLAVLPGWEDLAEKLAPLGVVTVVDLLEADRERIAVSLEVTVEDVGVWQSGAENHIK